MLDHWAHNVGVGGSSNVDDSTRPEEAFVERMQALAAPQEAATRGVPKVQRSKPVTVSQWLSTSESRDQAFLRAHARGGIRMTAIAQETGLSVSFMPNS